MKKIIDISERIFDVVTSELQEKSFFDTLEELSGIKVAAWQNVYYGKQKPTHEMIKFICEKWPEYSYWLTTGNLPKSEVKQIRPRVAVEKSWEEILKTEPDTWTEGDMQDALGSMLAIQVLREVGKIGGNAWDLQSNQKTLEGRQKIAIKRKMDEAIGSAKPKKANEIFEEFEIEGNRMAAEQQARIENKFKENASIKLLANKQKKVTAHGHKKD